MGPSVSFRVNLSLVGQSVEVGQLNDIIELSVLFARLVTPVGRVKRSVAKRDASWFH